MTLNKPLPTSIRIFLADGVPEGLRIVQKSNWTGKAVVAGRSRASTAFERPELGHSGVYVLTGQDDDGTSRLYVGEADVLRDRLRQHLAGKEFWTRFIAFTSTDEGLNKAHVRYLEARLIGLARSANQWTLDNGTEPALPPLSEADRADAELFLREMLVIFPLLAIDAFEEAGRTIRTRQEEGTPKEPDGESGGGEEAVTLFLRERGGEGTGAEADEGFVVFKGSRARPDEVRSIHAYLSALRRQLKDRGVLAEEGNCLLFTQDYRFGSPSMAAGVLVGGSANGRLVWKDRKGRTLKGIQEERAGNVGPV